MAGDATIVSPTSRPLPTTTLSTPGGSPASARISTKSAVHAGVSVAGLSTTVLPATSAGAAFHTGIAHGKFQGAISPTGPSGWRSV